MVHSINERLGAAVDILEHLESDLRKVHFQYARSLNNIPIYRRDEDKFINLERKVSYLENSLTSLKETIQNIHHSRL